MPVAKTATSTATPVSPPAAGQGEGDSSASGSFSSRKVSISSSGRQSTPEANRDDAASWKSGSVNERDVPAASELNAALTSAKKSRGLLAGLRNVIKAIIRLFTGSRAGAAAGEPLDKVANHTQKNGDVRTFANVQLLRQMEAGRNVAYSTSKLTLSISARKMADQIVRDPSILRNSTAAAANLPNLTRPGAAQKIIAAHQLPDEEHAQRVEDFQRAAGLLQAVYDSRFKSGDANTAFARFGSEENNPYQQMVDNQSLSMAADEDLRDWLVAAVNCANVATIALLESSEGTLTQVDMDQLEADLYKLAERAES